MAVTKEEIEKTQKIKSFSWVQLMEMFPHGPTALFLDRVWLRPDGKLMAMWHFRVNSQRYRDHFPPESGLPQMCPGVDLIEMANLAAACLYYLKHPEEAKSFAVILKGVDDFRLRGNGGGIADGTTVIAVAEEIESRTGLPKAYVELFVKDDVVAAKKAKTKPRQLGWVTVIGGLVPRSVC